MEEAEESKVMDLPDKINASNVGEDENSEDEEGRTDPIPWYRWVMHAAVMFGREFCYAMETALVTPVLLQIGLPEKYYSLTWFLSPILGLIFTPLIGSASDGCTLRWGRRRPFILALCTGVLLGVALFLNGAVIGLSIGDTPNQQHIGIVLTVLGVVVLDFCADAAEGPITAYLLDVADTDEQDMALNIHGLCAGLGGAVGYMLGGLDWTGTALGRAFKSQEQVLFMFAAVIFIISVTLHMFSIPERTNALSRHGVESSSQWSLKLLGHTQTSLEAIAEENAFGPASSKAEKELHPEGGEMDFLAVDRVRSKSDSVLAMPDATIELDSDLHLDRQVFLTETNFLPNDLDNAFKPSENSVEPSSPPEDPTDGVVVVESENTDGPQIKDPANGQPSIPQISSASENTLNDSAANGINAAFYSSRASNAVKDHSSTKPVNRTAHTAVPSRPLRPTFYRQPSFTFSYYGRVGTQRCKLRRTRPASPRPITTSRSLTDLRNIRQHMFKKKRLPSVSSLSSEGSSSDEETERGTTVRLLWLSMFKMPKQLWRLCVCHLFTWFSIIAESVFYTDFMGQVIYSGDPQAPANSTELLNYHRGVQMGCWGLVVYAATAAVCSGILQKSLDNFDLSIRVIYVVGTLGFSIGTAIMAIFPNVYVAMVMISSMGIISMSISYCPYALLGQYHEIKEYINHSPANTRRGFGIDCAILTCQVYISQILVASALGSVVEAFDSVRVIPVVASGGSFLGFLTACFLVIYPDPEPGGSEQDQDSDALPVEEDQNVERTNNQRLALLNLTDHTREASAV
ncbi:solute carrier family 45 member 4-like [Cyprinodon tularosa]|uniref:solute carrier family 45 member 4-like n=1 Tax=Cyprinodon tularosa TaxID=77115 RepID=UPI0018E21699|nr:solute carrier family 45 member 4-like [Cyprinodon tularosa]